MKPGASRAKSASTPGWMIVLRSELSDLWIGGKAIGFLILFSVLMGVMTFLFATNAELSLTPPSESLFLMLKMTLAVGLLFGLVLGADTISGERERATIESLLLTPVKRRDVIVGKYLAALSPWPAAMLVAAGYLMLIAPNMAGFVSAYFWMFVIGTVIVAAFTGFGVLVSVWSATNKASLSTSLLVYILFLVPTQLPGNAQASAVGEFIKRVNPLDAVNQFFDKLIVSNGTVGELVSWLASPLIMFGFVMAGLVLVGPSALRLEPPRLAALRGGAVPAVIFVVAALSAATNPSPALALGAYGQVGESVGDLTIEVDMASRQVKTGDRIEFQTLISTADLATGPWIVAMNIVNLGDGDPVDPEDWSPLRTQTIESVNNDGQAVLDWEVNAIIKGDYLIYMVVLASPESASATTAPVASQGIHLTVERFLRINPGGVLPLAIGMPLFLGWMLFAVTRRRSRLIDSPVGGRAASRG